MVERSGGVHSPIPEKQDLYRFLDRLNQAVAVSADADEILATTTRLTARHLGLSNCAYADMDEDQDGFTIRGNWHLPGSPSIVGHYQLKDFGRLAVQELSAGRPLIINDNLKEIAPEEAKTFQDIGIAATICMPLVKNDRLVALMAIHDRFPHYWSEYELDVIRQVTDRSWAHVQRVGAEAELQRSNSRFRAAIDAINGVLWTNDATGRMTGEQPGWQHLTGQRFDEYQGYGWSEAVHPEDRASTVEAWNKAVASRTTFVFEHRVRRFDGQWRRFSVRAVPITGPDGEIEEWVGVHSDITDERSAEITLREQALTLETLHRVGEALAGELDLQRVVQAVTDAGVEITGAQFGAFFYNVLNEQGESLMLYTLSGARPDQFDFGMPRNTAVFHPTFVGEGAVRSDDITKDPRYGLSAPHFGMPKDHLPVRSYLAVSVVSVSGKVIGGLFFGHPEPARFSDRHERILVAIAAQAAVAVDNAQLYEAVQRSNETLESRVRERTSELEAAYEALRQGQKMEAIGKFTGGVAHDFNNLLTVIKSAADLLVRPDLTEEKRKRYLSAISETADKAAALTSQLLAFARKQPLNPKVFDLAATIGEVRELLQSTLGSGVKLILEAKCQGCLVEADPTQLQAALVNLAVNSRDAMDGEGEFTISLARVEEGALGHGELRVADTGRGIDPGDLDRIFEPFFTTKAVGKGTGLGLSQVYGFVQQSGGSIQVESELERGATFVIKIPLTDKPLTEEREPRPVERSSDAAIHILLVEDNPLVGTFAADVLRDLGYEVTLASDAAHAIDCFKQPSRQFDLVLTDINMPGEMDGIDLAHHIKEQLPDLPVLLTSGYSEALARGEGSNFPLLRKPYSAAALESAIQKVRSAAL